MQAAVSGNSAALGRTIERAAVATFFCVT